MSLRICRCISLEERIVIPNTVKAIKKHAFCQCSGLMIVTLGEGLEEIEIEVAAFRHCKSLQHIVIPNNFKAIKQFAFMYCSGSMNV